MSVIVFYLSFEDSRVCDYMLYYDLLLIQMSYNTHDLQSMQMA